MPNLTFWYEPASTYSYLAAMRIDTLAAQKGVQVTWQPFLLGPIFGAQGWTSSPFNIYPAKGKNMWRDMQRQAEKYGLPPITQPDPFPQNTLLAARLCTIGQDQPWGKTLTRTFYTAQFAKGQGISTEAELTTILDALNLDADALLAQAKTDQPIKDKLRSATENAQLLGLYGAPSFTTPDGELFWGNDRLNDALDWAVSHA